MVRPRHTRRVKTRRSPSTPSDNYTKWAPQAGIPWQIVLQDALDIDDNSSIEPAGIDVFDVNLFTFEASTFAALQAQGKRVICCFSTSSYEPGRPDFKDFTKSILGLAMDRTRRGLKFGAKVCGAL